MRKKVEQCVSNDKLPGDCKMILVVDFSEF